jgi:hypothetical protein
MGEFVGNVTVSSCDGKKESSGKFFFPCRFSKTSTAFFLFLLQKKQLESRRFPDSKSHHVPFKRPISLQVSATFQ